MTSNYNYLTYNNYLHCLGCNATTEENVQNSFLFSHMHELLALRYNQVTYFRLYITQTTRSILYVDIQLGSGDIPISVRSACNVHFTPNKSSTELI